jgi:uncharacterized membrane protein
MRLIVSHIKIDEMTTSKTTISAAIFGAFMVLGGVVHFINPTMYDPFIPDALPKLAVNYAGGVVEIGLGLGVFVAALRKWALLGILLLMWAFLPLHVLDIFKEVPAVGSHLAAYIRLPLQFVLIYWAWYNYKQAVRS